MMDQFANMAAPMAEAATPGPLPRGQHASAVRISLMMILIDDDLVNIKYTYIHVQTYKQTHLVK